MFVKNSNYFVLFFSQTNNIYIYLIPFNLIVNLKNKLL